MHPRLGLKTPGKGQFISKAYCLDLDASKKRNKYLLISDLATRPEVLGSFLEELRRSKFAFETI